MYEYSKFWDFQKGWEAVTFLDHRLEKYIPFNFEKLEKYVFFAQKGWNFIFW